MSALESIRTLSDPAPQRAPEREREPRRRLVALPRPTVRRAPSVAHGVVALAGLGAIILGQLGLSMAIGEGAYEIASLQSTSAQLSREQQTLQEQLDALESPQQVALAAESLGMVQGQASEFLQLSTGAVLGGPDALHMQQPSVGADGSLLVGNEILQASTPAPQAPVAEEPAEPEPYPGMLLPAEGVAPTVGG
ncbi:hypothetical protein [Agrococcus sp. SGAir0287]|uniref:hypothetical protein n=1 Tax=Agrococcus sp. SGAir0287 TaxID=2070347 RepID=UPI001586681C|nr:hypothetical protein [Agrococcus sp. SGAir0287]